MPSNNVNIILGMIGDMEDTVPSNCPSMEGCPVVCLLGYKKNQHGCPICGQCETEEIVKDDI